MKPGLALRALLPCLLLPLSLPVGTISAAEEVLSFNTLPLPAEGELAGLLLAPNTDVTQLIAAPSGALYAAVEGAGGGIYTSVGGDKWSLVCASPDEVVSLKWQGDTLYYATKSGIFYSHGSTNFYPLSPPPGVRDGAEIVAMDVTTLSGGDMLAVATRASADGNGGIYILDRTELFSTWHESLSQGLSFGGVAFSPHFATDQRVFAVGSYGGSSWLMGLEGNSSWACLAELKSGGEPIPHLDKANIYFAQDYNDATPLFWVATDSGGEGQGALYRCFGSPYGFAEEVDISVAIGGAEVDITSLAISGVGAETCIAAGTAAGVVVISKDNGLSWEVGHEKPTGESVTGIVLPPEFITSGVSYCATSGEGSAISISEDFARNWDQCGLIDTSITYIVSMAVSPDNEEDNAIFLISADTGASSLWRASGSSWRRLYEARSPDCLDGIALGQGGVVYMSGQMSGQNETRPVLWSSFDNGRSFNFSPLPPSSAPAGVNNLSVAGDGTLFCTGSTGSAALIYRTTDGVHFTSAAAGSQPIDLLLISPGYSGDGIVLALDKEGGVFISNDRGLHFAPLAGAPEGISALAFGADFEPGRTLYAATTAATTAGAIYRLDMVEGGWTRMNTNLDEDPFQGYTIDTMAISDGVIYATSVSPDEGMIRALINPYNNISAELVLAGLAENAVLQDLSLNGGRVWVTDTQNNNLLFFIDSLSRPPLPTQPQDEARGEGVALSGGAGTIYLDWQGLHGATQYEWQLSRGSRFSTSEVELEGRVTQSEVSLPPLQLATTYYWRVRAVLPLYSPWSKPWSFTTVLGGAVSGPQMESPQPGAVTTLKPLFQWSPIAGATAYELEVALDPAFQGIVIGEEALPTSAWQSEVPLEPDTTYYWRVRAVSPSSSSAWSATGVFTTQGAPAPIDTASTVTVTFTLNPAPPPPVTLTVTETKVASSVIPYPTAITLPPAPTVTITLTPPPQSGTELPEGLIYGAFAAAGLVTIMLVTILVLVIKRR